MQSIPGAILNKAGAESKIAKIICMNVVAETLDQPNYSNLYKLINETISYVDKRLDDL